MKRSGRSLARVMIVVAAVAINLAILKNVLDPTRVGRGFSIFGLESAFWDPSLLPLVMVLLFGLSLLGRSTGKRKQFLRGFEVLGWATVVAYLVCCSPPARSWNPLTAFLPFASGIVFSPGPAGRHSSSARFGVWGVVADMEILALLLLTVPLAGGLMAGRMPRRPGPQECKMRNAKWRMRNGQ